MEHIEDQDSHGNEHALECNEQVLTSHELTIPTLAQFSDTEYTAPHDEEGRETEADEEAFEELAGAHGNKGWVLWEDGGAVGSVPAPDADGEVGRYDDEAEDGGDLEGETDNHDVGAKVNGFVVGGGDGGEGTTEGLKDEGDDIARDEL